ncbi:hypothetical protein IPF36_14925 [Cupriavidus sp. IK-TO18]|nr:hypothetical protein [Cupriavidus sp. IK-TO18]
MNPTLNALASLFRDLELHWPLSFLLHDCCPGANLAANADVLHAQTGQVARSELAVDGKVEHRQFANIRRKLKPSSYRPYLIQLQWRLLARQPPFVPWDVTRLVERGVFHDGLLSNEGKPVCASASGR